MPPIKRPNQRVRTKSTDSVRVIELRKERSRDAARNRRGKENLQFDELAKLLPLPEAITSQLDKASIVRLTISYLNMKEFSGVTPRQGTLDSNSSVASISSLPSDCSHSPLSDHDFDSGSPSGDVNDHDSLALTVYKKRTPLSEVFESDTGIHMLQALDGFLFVVSEDGKFLYVSETVSVHLGLSQVELTGNNMYNYVHPEDHEDLNDVLTSGYSTAKPVSSPVRDIPLFGKGPLSPDPEQEGYPKKKPVSFFVRMKCTLVRRGGSYTKSTGFKVIHCIGRMREYRNDNGMSKFGLVCIGQPLPQLTINELPLECNMFVSRVGMDLKIVYCEGRIHKFMDYYAKDIVGISAYDFYHMGDVSLVQDAHLKFLTKGQVITKYYRWMNKNGGWVWMQTKASLIPHPDNPDIKQMLCLNYIVSNVEHRGVVLGMTQLKDKPMLPSATITELDPSIENDNGDLVDASIQDNCVVFPKWQKCQGNELFARQSNADTYPLGFGSPNSGGAFNLDNEVFTQWQGSDKQSDFEDNLEDVQDLIDSEMTDFDHDLANYVVNGSEMPFTLRPPDEDLTEDFLASNLYPDSNISNSNVPGNVYGTPSGSAQFPNYVNQSTVPQRKRMATENVLGPNSLSFDNNGMYCAAPRSSTQKDCSVIPSKVPRLNHISSVPTATITTPVQQPITGTAEVIVPVSTQGLTQSNVPSYQMVGSSRYQQNNGFVTTKDFQGVVCRGPNQISGVSQGLAAPQVPPGTNGGTPRTEELMVNLVDEMLTDPQLHITNDFQKQNNFNNKESSYVSQKQFKSTVYPMLETKIKQEVKSPTVSEATFFGPVVNRGNFQATQNSITQANRPSTVVNNANLQSYSQVTQPTQPTHPPRVNQPLNCTVPQNICSPSMHSSSVFPNQNSAKRNHNFAPPTGVVNSSQNTEFVSPQMNGEHEQLRLRAILEQGNMATNLNGRQQQYSFKPNVQQSYTTLSTQNSMAPQRKPGVDPMQNVMHQAGFSYQNLPPGPYPGSQLNTFQQLNNSGSSNVNKTRQNINFPDVKLQ